MMASLDLLAVWTDIALVADIVRDGDGDMLAHVDINVWGDLVLTFNENCFGDEYIKDVTMLEYDRILGEL